MEYLLQNKVWRTRLRDYIIEYKLEVDFVANRGNHRCYIQSAFAIPDEVKRLQETNSLRRINDSYRKIVIVRHPIVPWYDESGIYYIGLEDFCPNYIDELDSTL